MLGLVLGVEALEPDGLRMPPSSLVVEGGLPLVAFATLLVVRSCGLVPGVLGALGRAPLARSRVALPIVCAWLGI